MKYGIPAGRFVLMVLALVLSPYAATAATTYYVATTGNDGNDGTSLVTAFATPKRGVAAAQAGDTVEIHPGVYTLTQELSITKPGVTIKGAVGQRPRLVASSKASGPQTVVRVYASRVTVEALELEGGSYYGIKLDNAYGVQTDQTIRGCYIHHTGRDGIKTQSADNLLIEGNEIAFTGMRDASNADGIDVMGSLGVTIRGNHLHDIATNGLYVKGGTVGAVVERNLVERTGYAGILLGSESGISFMRDGVPFEASDSVARNNIVIDAAMTGLGTVAGWNVRFYNNTVVGAARVAHAAFRAVPNQYGVSPQDIVLKNNVFALAATSTRPLVHLLDAGALTSDYNLWFSPLGNYVFIRESAGGTTSYQSLSAWRAGMGVDANSAAANPMLDADQRPMVGSPALDVGTDLGELLGTTFEFSDDYAGAERSGAWDIGAWEGASTATPPPPDALAAPTGLVATASSGTVVQLQWTDRSSAENGFIIERKTTRDKTYREVGRVAGNVATFTDTGLATGTAYTYRVAAYRVTATATEMSAFSNEASVTTPRR